jgi:hypothetical protein
MKKRRRNKDMLIPTIIMGVLAVILLFIGYSKGQGQHIIGTKSAIKMMIQIVPLLIFAFIIAGMIQVLLPKEFLSKWVGTAKRLPNPTIFGLKNVWNAMKRTILNQFLNGLNDGGITENNRYDAVPSFI